MTASSTSLFIVDDGEFYRTGQTNYGPLGVGAGFRLTKLEVFGSIAFKSTVLSPGPGYMFSRHVVGVQWGFAGYVPYDFFTAAELDGHTWLFGQDVEPSASAAFWAPETDSAVVYDRYQFGYRKFFQEIDHSLGRDFYLSFCDMTTGAPAEYRVFGTFRLFYE